ncbi:hypothetical protein DSO57_1025872 [Entomophthora muscae]|uniref:Uncharacterized protein n=1 Tax=Entomophthora muscae TaxID=34485 RepID=A0ACC2T244_9FUNG|nr:hypothetical protein DSO57_1025872 [Entomophthora muscae]
MLIFLPCGGLTITYSHPKPTINYSPRFGKLAEPTISNQADPTERSNFRHPSILKATIQSATDNLIWHQEVYDRRHQISLPDPLSHFLTLQPLLASLRLHDPTHPMLL